MPPRKIRTRAPRPNALNLKKAKAAVPVAAFLCTVALFAQSAFRIAGGSSIEAELLSLGFPLMYSATADEEGGLQPPDASELPSPIRIDRADIDVGVSESVRIELLRVEEAPAASRASSFTIRIPQKHIFPPANTTTPPQAHGAQRTTP